MTTCYLYTTRRMIGLILSSKKEKFMKKKEILIILGILFISFNLRAPITAVGSLVEMIQEEFVLTSASAGFITTLPLLAFAIVSPFVARLSRKLGPAHTMMIGLVFILLGVVVRSYTGLYGLFIGTGIIGIGIAIGNVMIPAIIKSNFSEKVGMVTSIYTSGMCIFAAVGAGISVPLAQGMQLGWKHALAIWFALTIVTIIIWLPQLTKKEKTSTQTQEVHSETSIWKSPLAWAVTMFMGLQSLLFYSLVAWLPTIVMSKGMSAEFAGNMALLFQLMAIPATLIIPTLADRYHHQKGLVVITCLIYAAGMFAFLVGQTSTMLLLAVILMAVGMGGSISLSIAFISLRSPNHVKASELSGMSQSAGYLFAAAGPILTGYIFDVQQSWTMPLVIFIILILALAFFGMFAGHHHTVKK